MTLIGPLADIGECYAVCREVWPGKEKIDRITHIRNPVKRNCLTKICFNADICSGGGTNNQGTKAERKKHTEGMDAERRRKQTHIHLPDTNKLPAGL
jgi:hypothetical protein